MITFIALIILSIGAGVLYRCGGAGKPYNTKYRDLGVPLIATLALLILGGFKCHLWLVMAYIAAFGLLFASLTTYWDFLFKKDTFWFSGLVVGLSGLPVSLAYGKCIGCIVRMAIIAGVWQLLNELLPQKVFCWTRDIVEEFGRGVITILTLPLLLI
jgi:hypothetical protein